MRIGFAGRQRHIALVHRDGFIIPAQARVKHPQPVVQLLSFRINGQSLLDDLDGLIRLFLAIEQAGQSPVGFDLKRELSDDLTERPNGAGIVSSRDGVPGGDIYC